MSDQCKHCSANGSVKDCDIAFHKYGCSIRESWYSINIERRIVELEAANIRAYNEGIEAAAKVIFNTSEDWFIGGKLSKQNLIDMVETMRREVKR